MNNSKDNESELEAILHSQLINEGMALSPELKEKAYHAFRKWAECDCNSNLPKIKKYQKYLEIIKEYGK